MSPNLGGERDFRRFEAEFGNHCALDLPSYGLVRTFTGKPQFNLSFKALFIRLDLEHLCNLPQRPLYG
jgi:hypothetical protein